MCLEASTSQNHLLRHRHLTKRIVNFTTMITKEEVNRLRFSKETSRVERTTSKRDMDKFQEAICAFSNDMANSRKPGYLMVGVHDDYRNRLIASAFKALGYVNMFNWGVKEVQTLLKENGNSPAVFNVKNLTVFEVTVYSSSSSQKDKSKVTSQGVLSRGTSWGTSQETSQETDNPINQHNSSNPIQDVARKGISQSVPSRGVPSRGTSQGVPSRDVGMEIVLKGIIKYCSEPKSLKEISEYLGIKAFKRVKTRYINPLLSDKKLKMTIPDKPTSRFQKYVTLTRSDKESD